jgi:hypothetical protein
MEKEAFEVRDMRSKEKFFVNDEYLNGYARLCGANATLVYLCLCRHADRYQESFPSIKVMAEKTGVSERSIIRGIQTLERWRIISKERERRSDATWLNNRYVLLDKSAWKTKPSDTESLGEPSDKSDISQVTVSHTKDTHTYKKDTHTYTGGLKNLEDGQSTDSPRTVSFEDFWNIYPRKEGKKKAEAAWKKVSEENRAKILKDIPRRKETEQWKKEGGSFIPHAATYLNGERWNDEIIVGKKAKINNVAAGEGVAL